MALERFDASGLERRVVQETDMTKDRMLFSRASIGRASFVPCMDGARGARGI
jgi:hypothetical protein